MPSALRGVRLHAHGVVLRAYIGESVGFYALRARDASDLADKIYAISPPLTLPPFLPSSLPSLLPPLDHAFILALIHDAGAFPRTCLGTNL